jgi:hypothetical protein
MPNWTSKKQTPKWYPQNVIEKPEFIYIRAVYHVKYETLH